MTKPRALRPGDRIGIIAPASPFDRQTFDRGVAELRTLGFEPVFEESIFERRAYVAGSAETRARRFQAAWRDPSTAGVMAVRGGFGSAHLLPLLDPAELGRSPKALIGCSDLTALHTFLTQQCGLVTLHGPMVVTLARGEAGYDRESLLAHLTGRRPPHSVVAGELAATRAGRARGPLLGGTLSLLAASLGTRYAFDPPDGHILLLDDIGERPYRLDRLLTQLRQAGILARAGGVVCACFPDCDEPDGSLTAHDALNELLADIRGPVVRGLPTGHTAGAPMLTVPLGVEVTVEAEGATGRLTVEEEAVA
ncbi:MAG: LD-carboxypeptidase [Acidobacteria bacterium]|nr:LD-carboxypeptidase [Acidobacteriota bacterium]